MKKRRMNSWYKRILAFSLAFMMMLQPAMVSVAAEPQPSTEVEISDSSVESTEDASTEEAVTDESATEEDVTEEATEAISEEVVSEEISEETVSEEVSTEEAVSEDSSEETASEEIVDDNSINSTSTDADFVIESGVLISYTGTATDVIIPSGVTTIGEGVFRENDTVVSVTFPENLTTIEAYAFRDCENLQTVTVNEKLVTIGNYAFYQCKNLKSFTCPSTVKTIGEYAFTACTSLFEVTLNEGLESIGNYAFLDAAFGGLNENKVTVYGTLTIPSTVSSVGYHAFESSEFLGEVIFADGKTETITFAVRYETEKSGLFYDCEKLTKVTFPERATIIPAYAFQNCIALEEFDVGDNIVTIDAHAFDQCKSLKTFTCPASVESIGNFAFAYCESLMEVNLNEGLMTIGNSAFTAVAFGGKDENKKTVYGTLTIPTTVYSIGTFAFLGCTYLEEVVFPDSEVGSLELVDSYGSACTFQGCTALKRVYLPERLTEIPGYTFQRCNALDTLYIPNGVSSIAENVFENTDTTNLVIYCDEGSVARIFAKTHGYNYKDKSELGIYVKSLKLNREDIYFEGETAIGKEITLNTTVSPATALNKVVTYKSTNEAVATVDTTGIVTIKGYGEADIIVTSLENSEITATCHVEIIGMWTEEEVEAVRTYIVENNDFRVIKNIYKNLQEVEIKAPEGVTAEWKLPYEIEKGDFEYDIHLSKEGYPDTILEEVTVNGTVVEGIQIIEYYGSNVIKTGGQSSLTALVAKDGECPLTDYQIEWDSSNYDNINVVMNPAHSDRATAYGLKASKGNVITCTLVLNKNGTPVSLNNSDLGKTWFKATIKTDVVDYDVVNSMYFEVSKDGEEVSLTDLEKLQNVEEPLTFDVTANVEANKVSLTSVPLTWKSSNTKVATVKADKSGKVTLTVLGKGTSYISATASKNGGYSHSFKVTVVDTMPRLTEKDVTINGYMLVPSSAITLIASDGYEIDNNSFSVTDAKTGADTAFEVKYDNGYSIAIKDGQTVKKGTYSVNILVKTSAGESEAHKLPLKVKVVETAPKVKIEQTTALLYEKNATANIKVVTDADVESIIYTPSATFGSPRFVSGDFNASDKSLNVVAENATAANFSKTSNKGVLKVKFAGYKDIASYNGKITVSVNKKLPKLQAQLVSSTLYPETPADSSRLFLYNETVREYMYHSRGYNISIKSMSNYLFTDLNKDDVNYPLVQALKGAKSGKLAITATNSKWLDGISVSFGCNVKIGKVPTLSFAYKAVTLNTAYPIGAYEPVAVDCYVKGYEKRSYNNRGIVVFDDAKLQVKGKDANAQKVLDDGALSIYMEDGVLKTGITDAGYFKKAGNYTYIITAYSEDNQPVSGTLKISVVLANKQASISYKTKGTIDILNRSLTSVTVTPTIKNYTGTVTDVELYGADAGKFEIKLSSLGVITIEAKSGVALKSGGTYQVGIYSTLDSGVTLQNTVKIVPKQKNPKLKTDKNTIVLYETSKGSSNGEEFRVFATSGLYVIQDVELVNYNDTFECNGGWAGQCKLFVNEYYRTNKMVPGKKYKLKLAVTFKDQATNAKPTYVTITVDYRK